MKKLLISIPEELMENIDEAIKMWGFANRTEFFRFSALEFLRQEARKMPADDVLKEHTRAIKVIKTRQDSAELKRDWIKANPYLHKE